MITRKIGGWRRHTAEEKSKLKPLDILLLIGITPSSYDQRPKWPPVYDQGDEGSCTANGSGGAVHFYLKQMQYKWPFTPSRAFIYYNTRLTDGSLLDVMEDCGGTISGAIAAIAKYGCCPEDGNPAWSMPYVPGDYRTKPTSANYKDALLHVALEHQSVPQTSAAINSLLARDIPVVFGFDVYDSFMSDDMAKSGIMSIPAASEKIQGGHCVVAVGFLTDYPAGNQGVTSWYICRNSWGDKWGQAGYFLMPEQVLLSSMASDFGIITNVGFSRGANDVN